MADAFGGQGVIPSRGSGNSRTKVSRRAPRPARLDLSYLHSRWSAHYAWLVVKNSELETTLSRLPDVDAVRIVGDDGHIVEVHVLATPGKAPKQIVRDVQSLAMAAHGVNVDRRVVSVVQMENENVSTIQRPVILDIDESPNGSKLTITVSLGWHRERHTGSATGPASQETRPRLVGEATLGALEEAVSNDVAFALANIELQAVGSRTIAIAVVVMVAGGEERALIGSALVGTDPAPAAVRAVLDAVNRQVPNLSR